MEKIKIKLKKGSWSIGLIAIILAAIISLLIFTIL